MTKNIKNTVPWTYVISYLNGEEIFVRQYEKELEKTRQTEFRVEKGQSLELNVQSLEIWVGSLVVSDGFHFQSGFYLCAEVSSLQQSPG